MRENVGPAGLHVFDGGFDVAQILAFVAPHQEHAGLDAVLAAQRDCFAHLLDRDAALHGIQDSLRAALRADPHAKAAQFRQRLRHLADSNGRRA